MTQIAGLLYFLAIILGITALFLLTSALFSKRRKRQRSIKERGIKNISFISFNVFLLGFNVLILMLFPWAMYYSKSENQVGMIIIFCFIVAMMSVAFLLILVDKSEKRKNVN